MNQNIKQTSDLDQSAIDVRAFIQKNYQPYEGDESFLASPTDRTHAIWQQVLDLMKEEHKAGGVLVENILLDDATSFDLRMLNRLSVVV